MDNNTNQSITYNKSEAIADAIDLVLGDPSDFTDDYDMALDVLEQAGLDVSHLVAALVGKIRVAR
jgi:hypothetical protein